MSGLDVLRDVLYAIFQSVMVGGAAWLVLRWVFEQDWYRTGDD